MPLLWWAVGWSRFGLIQSPGAQQPGVARWATLASEPLGGEGNEGLLRGNVESFAPKNLSWQTKCNHGDGQCFLQSQGLWSELFGTGDVTLATELQHYGVRVTDASMSLWFGYASCFPPSQGWNILLLAAKRFLGWKLSHSYHLPEIIPAWPTLFPSSSVFPLLGFSGNQGQNVFPKHTGGLASVVCDTDHCTWQSACASSRTASFHCTVKMWLNGN